MSDFQMNRRTIIKRRKSKIRIIYSYFTGILLKEFYYDQKDDGFISLTNRFIPLSITGEYMVKPGVGNSLRRSRLPQTYITFLFFFHFFFYF